MKNKLLVLLAMSAFGSASAGPLTGTWKAGDPKHGGGVLLVIDRAPTVKFQLELWRGGPTYNEGSLEGDLTVKNGKATFVQRANDSVCRITFEFRGEKVTLRQIEGSDADCGFGYGVHAEGTFKRTSPKLPDFTKPE